MEASIRFGCGHIETVPDGHRWAHLLQSSGDGVLDVRKRKDGYHNPFPTLCSVCQRERENHIVETDVDP